MNTVTMHLKAVMTNDLHDSKIQPRHQGVVGQHICNIGHYSSIGHWRENSLHTVNKQDDRHAKNMFTDVCTQKTVNKKKNKWNGRLHGVRHT